jgi:hypothetical protein
MKFEFYFCGVGIEVERHCMRGIRNGGARGGRCHGFSTHFFGMGEEYKGID